MNSQHQSKYLKHFLGHHQGWGIVLLGAWLTTETALLSTTQYMEAKRTEWNLPFWEALCWEATSIIMIALLIWPIVIITERLKSQPLKKQLLTHALLTLPFSIVHVAGMVLLREFCYLMASSDYQFGNIAYEFLYEYRKDIMTYFMIVVVTQSYQFIVRRLKGEAAQLNQSEDDNSPLPGKLLVKKLGKEFLVEVASIEWIEAAGNYANLHIGQQVYPMRATMSKLEQQLPSNFCCIHRSRIVNIHYVQHCAALDSGDYSVTLNDDLKLGMSRRYREHFKEQLTR